MAEKGGNQAVDTSKLTAIPEQHFLKRTETVLIEAPIDLPGASGTAPSLILVFECGKCKAHGYMEADAAPLYGASCPSQL